MRARTSGHAILIRGEGNTDPRHDGKRRVKPIYKNPVQVLSLYYEALWEDARESRQQKPSASAKSVLSLPPINGARRLA